MRNIKRRCPTDVVFVSHVIKKFLIIFKILRISASILPFSESLQKKKTFLYIEVKSKSQIFEQFNIFEAENRHFHMWTFKPKLVKLIVSFLIVQYYRVLIHNNFVLKKIYQTSKLRIKLILIKLLINSEMEIEITIKIHKGIEKCDCKIAQFAYKN